MTDTETSALINRLERAYRQWRRLALGALAALLLVLLIGSVAVVFQRQQMRAEQQRAQQAIREAQDQRERELYFSRIALAEREWSQRRDNKP